jgi:transmembrane sensor
VVTQVDDDREKRVAEEAAMWLEKLERTLKRDESAHLRAWLKSRYHRQVIVQRCKLWHGPEILAILGELVSVESLHARVERQYGRVVLAIFLGVSGIGFATVLIAVSKIWPGAEAGQNAYRLELDLRTEATSGRNVRLPDGSLLRLGSGTRVLVSYGTNSRDVTLLRGEATFAVSVESRSFNVYAFPRRFEAQLEGTRFNLRRVDNDQVELIVIAGQVTALAASQRAPLPPALLRARPSFGEHTFKSSQAGTLGAGWQLTRALTPQEVEAHTA